MENNKFLVQCLAHINNKGEVIGVKIPRVKFKPLDDPQNKTLAPFNFLCSVEVLDSNVVKFLKTKIKFEEE
jgi:hypothetical protein